jgi:hypothetical protein
VTVTVDLGRAEIFVWLAPKGTTGEERSLLECLAARDLPVPGCSLVGRSFDSVRNLVDDYASALRLLRPTELAGEGVPLERDKPSVTLERRKELVEEIVQRARRLRRDAGE